MIMENSENLRIQTKSFVSSFDSDCNDGVEKQGIHSKTALPKKKKLKTNKKSEERERERRKKRSLFNGNICIQRNKYSLNVKENIFDSPFSCLHEQTGVSRFIMRYFS